MPSPADAALRAPKLLAVLVGLLLLAPAPALLIAPAAAGAGAFVLAGTVSDWDGNELAGVTVSVLPVGGGAAVASDTSRTIDDADGSYQVNGVQPGAYRLRFEKAGYATTYLENGEDEGPVTVTVSGSGAVSAPAIDLDEDGLLPDVTLLLQAPTMAQAPKLTGRAVVGQTLTLSAGSWSGIDVDPDSLTVDWFLDGEAADDFSDGDWWQEFDVPLEAVGTKVGFRLTVSDPDGARADAVFEGSSAVVPRAVSSVKGTVKRTKLTVVVSVPGVDKPTGKVSVTSAKKVVGSAKLISRSNGKVVVKLKKLRPGKRKLSVSYVGPSTILPAKTVVRVKIPK